MYCRVLACDFDGTGASNGRLAPEVALALGDARRHGVVTMLVTGRVLADLREAAVDPRSFDAIVAENGALVWLPDSDRTLQLAPSPPECFLGSLRRHGIPFHVGSVVVGTWDRHAGEVLAIVRELGLDSQLVFNRAALMVLPTGVTKASGVRRALAELGRSERNMVAFGDAENDLPLFAVAEVGVAARGAVPGLAAVADEHLSQPGSAGIAHWVQRMLVHEAQVPTPPRRRIECGTLDDGTVVTLPSSGTDVLVSGDPKSGKSWVAGLVAERLLEQGYGLLVIDPEGDYIALAERCGVLGLGLDLPLPAPEAVGRLLRQGWSVVVHLSTRAAEERAAYVQQLLGIVAVTQARTGLPHWTLVDEAHYWLGERALALPALAARSGNLLLVTYRPSLVAPSVVERAGAHLVLRTSVEDERYFVTTQLQTRGPENVCPAAALAALDPSNVGLLLRGPAGVHWQVFTPAPRASRHVHRGRKYAESHVGEERAFRFLDPDGGVVETARCVREFCGAVQLVPATSLRRHLLGGDFSRWARDVLEDDTLAGGLCKLEETTRAGAPASRGEIVAHVEALYLL